MIIIIIIIIISNYYSFSISVIFTLVKRKEKKTKQNRSTKCMNLIQIQYYYNDYFCTLIGPRHHSMKEFSVNEVIIFSLTDICHSKVYYCQLLALLVWREYIHATLAILIHERKVCVCPLLDYKQYSNSKQEIVLFVVK